MTFDCTVLFRPARLWVLSSLNLPIYTSRPAHLESADAQGFQASFSNRAEKVLRGRTLSLEPILHYGIHCPKHLQSSDTKEKGEGEKVFLGIAPVDTQALSMLKHG